MRYIDKETWKRKAHYEFFSRMDYPQYNVCANVDVTSFRKFTKEKKVSFYHAMVYVSTLAAKRGGGIPL